MHLVRCEMTTLNSRLAAVVLMMPETAYTKVFIHLLKCDPSSIWYHTSFARVKTPNLVQC